jgi:hypothetical protein
MRAAHKRTAVSWTVPSIVVRRLAWLGIALILVAGCALPGSSTAHPAPGTPTTSTQAGDFLVGANVDVSNATGAQDEVSAAVDPADPNTLLSGSNSLQVDPSVRVYGSSDAGLHWTSALLPLPTTAKSPGAVDQWAAIGPDHRQAMAYIAFGKPPSPLGDGFNGLTLYVATRSGPTASWMAPTAPVDGLPPQQSYDDKPALAADNGPASPYRGWLYVAWTRWIGQDGWLLVSSSADWGQTWATPQALRHQGDDWGAAIAVAPDGAVTVAWAASNSLWIARSTDGGAHFSAPVAFGACPAPMNGCTGGAKIAAQSDAGVRANPAVVELPAAGAQSAQALAIYTTGDGAHTHIELARVESASLSPLGSPVTVPLGQPGTDQFLPAAAYDSTSRALWVCAYVSSVQTPADARYTCTASLDAGASFLPPVAVAAVASNEEQPGAFRSFIGRQFGDYTAVAAAAGVVHVFWTDSRQLASAGEEVYTATLRLRPRVGGTG